MKKFFNQLFLFSIPGLTYIILAVLLMPTLLSLQNGPSTKRQIDTSFKNAIKRDYEMLILGNSRTYRGINPDFIKMKCYNFSHDNDSYNQSYYKLDFIIKKHKKIKYLILGMDYFQFSIKSDTRNYVYADFFAKEYLNDYENENILKKKIEYYCGNADPKKLLSLFPKEKKPVLRKNGQLAMFGFSKESDKIERNIKRLDFQVDYFEKILRLCKNQNIKVIIVTLPTRVNELKSYNEKQLIEFYSFFNKYIDNKNTFYLNYCYHEDFKTFDYADATHLNESGANHFSHLLNQDLMHLIYPQSN
ncbi:MAG: hypothetical protein H6Q25_667 [Bacteroidetes bacterium]|nr:hypothetical protein [Bacteroidota bacterium]